MRVHVRPDTKQLSIVLTNANSDRKFATMDAMDLRKKRVQLGFKQCEVARAANIPASRLCAGENGYIILRPDEVESLEVALRHLATARAAALQRELVS